MIVLIDRNDDVFSDDLVDELNSSFSSIHEKIKEYKTEDLEYPEPIQYFSKSDSFRAGNILSIRETITVPENYSEFTQVGSIPTTIPFEYWGFAITENNENLVCYIKGSEIFLYGPLSYYPQKAYVNTDIVLP